jgi:hypothetical protein
VGRTPTIPEENDGPDIAGRAPHPNPLAASGEREGPAKREGEGQQAADLV